MVFWQYKLISLEGRVLKLPAGCKVFWYCFTKKGENSFKMMKWVGLLWEPFSIAKIITAITADTEEGILVITICGYLEPNTNVSVISRI